LPPESSRVRAVGATVPGDGYGPRDTDPPRYIEGQPGGEQRGSCSYESCWHPGSPALRPLVTVVSQIPACRRTSNTRGLCIPKRLTERPTGVKVACIPVANGERPGFPPLHSLPAWSEFIHVGTMIDTGSNGADTCTNLAPGADRSVCPGCAYLRVRCGRALCAYLRVRCGRALPADLRVRSGSTSAPAVRGLCLGFAH
jgi:hypothetical protein